MPRLPAGIGGSGSLMSQRTHSVVRSMPAMLAALSAEPTAHHSRATRQESTGLSLLGGVDDAALEEVLVLLGAGVVAVVRVTVGGRAAAVTTVLHLIHDDAAFEAGVLDNHAQRLLDGAADDLDAELLVLVLGFHLGKLLCGADEGGAATGNDTLLDGCAGGVQGIVEAVFLLLHLDLRSGADVDDGHAAGQLGEALLQLLAALLTSFYLIQRSSQAYQSLVVFSIWALI